MTKKSGPPGSEIPDGFAKFGISAIQHLYATPRRSLIVTLVAIIIACKVNPLFFSEIWRTSAFLAILSVLAFFILFEVENVVRSKQNEPALTVALFWQQRALPFLQKMEDACFRHRRTTLVVIIAIGGILSLIKPELKSALSIIILFPFLALVAGPPKKKKESGH